ncbi:hypothetical protein KY334_03590 [Candidatus Woesearchaeota archaeon]|nr:hypothetical protein [Candidatus Woesearchaeota archaeon]
MIFNNNLKIIIDLIILKQLYNEDCFKIIYEGLDSEEINNFDIISKILNTEIISKVIKNVDKKIPYNNSFSVGMEIRHLRDQKYLFNEISKRNYINEKIIKEFLIENVKNIKHHGFLFSDHKFYMNHPDFNKYNNDFLLGIIEPNEFIIENFEELYTHDEGYAFSLFFLLDMIIKKYGDKDLGFFKEIYNIGEKIFKTEVTDDDIKKAIKETEEAKKKAEGMI